MIIHRKIYAEIIYLLIIINTYTEVILYIYFLFKKKLKQAETYCICDKTNKSYSDVRSTQ